jgi:hypothetical protein
MGVVFGALLVLLTQGCALEERKALGEECGLNSDCDAPLVCRLSRCRNECATSRDCALGLDCILDDNRLGACQLPSDIGCSVNSDCDEPLVCRGATSSTSGRCVNECAEERDCAPGQICCPVSDDERCSEIDATSAACFEPDRETCLYNDDCPNQKICADDGRCRLECREVGSTRDCLAGEVCVRIGSDVVGFSQVCGDSRLLDAGVPDAAL